MTEQMSRHEFKALPAKPAKLQKYGNEKVLHDGVLFDSKAERNYYAHLKLRERAGEIEDLKLQRPFDLMVNGVLVARYVADMVFFDRITRRRRVVDVKGCVTPAFRLKAKLMKACHGIEIEVVR
ncbi:MULTISPECIES: DUF1064 domain-containing protein [unclassified Rhizobium]|uniref:DUF1064 domain-containing protein n=1 Tax=unclassified Rhizobium TaxID=2613769 RepID=UPI001ADBAF49|nr:MULTISPECIES: DUF1064 domain-containing protein [unclassified Rhizobium]MBO9099460.1 DUF1064 domain-containing protein [Rhizobium sp. L58/93]QXZ87056.1 DUF1064 domain-containing protein [Rhizobium sp. K1/93]QXZ92910.1 DUF1064 domain-containing protein [Rhizobium sp. K15/93]